MEDLDELLVVIQEVRRLQQEIQDTCFQAYCYVCFATAGWNWGHVLYRLEMSGQGYEADFSNREELIERLHDILKLAKDGCRSV